MLALETNSGGLIYQHWFHLYPDQNCDWLVPIQPFIALTKRLQLHPPKVIGH